MKQPKLKMLSSEILRDTVRKVKDLGKVSQLARDAECTAAFLYWFLEDDERDMRLDLACRIYNQSIKILRGHKDQAIRIKRGKYE